MIENCFNDNVDVTTLRIKKVWNEMDCVNVCL